MVKTPKAYKDKGEQNAPPTPRLLSKTGTSVTLIPIEGAEYTMDHKTWQDSNTFYNLTPSTEYLFYARMKETDELKESMESYPLELSLMSPEDFPLYPEIIRQTVSLSLDGHIS